MVRRWKCYAQTIVVIGCISKGSKPGRNTCRREQAKEDITALLW